MASAAQPPSEASTGAADADPSQTQEAFTLLAQGKRHLLVKDYSEAVSSLGQACTLLAAKFGETASECGDAYLFYGKALLELARAESGVLGDAIEGEADGASSEEDSDGEGESAENGNGEEEGEKKEGTVENGQSGKAEETDLDVKDSKEDKSEEEAQEDAEKEAPDGSKQEEDSEEDVSNLKLAWEMLEMAKLIFQRQPSDKQTSLKLGEVFLRLGEVSLESETYAQAIEDIKQCLELQKQHLEADNRLIAETYYQLGMAYSLNNEFDEAIKHYCNSLELLEGRVENLQAKEASGAKPQETDAFYTLEGEVKELQGIIPEIRDKVAEMREMKTETLKAVSEKLSGSSDGAGSSKGEAAAASPAVAEKKPVSDISHLVRKKRKADEEPAAAAAAAAVAAAGDGKGTLPAKVAKSE